MRNYLRYSNDAWEVLSRTLGVSHQECHIDLIKICLSIFTGEQYFAVKVKYFWTFLYKVIKKL